MTLRQLNRINFREKLRFFSLIFQKNKLKYKMETTGDVTVRHTLEKEITGENNADENSVINTNQRQVRCRGLVRCQRSCSGWWRGADGESMLCNLMPRWMPTSAKHLEEAEQKILSCLTVPYESSFIEIDGGENKIRTLKFNPSGSTRTPYVLVHGFGSGVGLWALNLESLSEERPLYAFDILGFGRSSRPKFPMGAEAAEGEFVRSIEEWRKAVGVEQMILVGHSMGGFLSSAYTLSYPERVKHLVLLDPWGYPSKETDDRMREPLPFWMRVIGTIVLSFNPLSSVRAAGPFGPWLVRKTRGDIGRKFSSLFEGNNISNYIYHCNAQNPSGEKAFKDMSSQLGWAARPMLGRIGDIDSNIPLTMFYGSRTWMDIDSAWAVKNVLPRSKVHIQIIKGAGHHVYADKCTELNRLVNKQCQKVP